MTMNKFILGQLMTFLKDTLRVCRKLYALDPFKLTEEHRQELLAIVYSLKRLCGSIEKMLKLPPEATDTVLHKI